MLGYVKCKSSEMLVKHYALYQAMYCGLCNSIKRNIGNIGLPFQSYDFVFLAFLRILATEEKVEVEKQFCLLHPFGKKKKRVKDNKALSFSAVSGLFLTCEKLKDDLFDRDLSFFRRGASHIFYRVLENKRKKILSQNPEFANLSASLSLSMEKGRELEKNGADLDEMCSFFAETLSQILAFGLEGEKGRILAEIGDKLGRFLYTLDAMDDIEKDEKNGAFNPILKEYGSVQSAKENFHKLDMVLSFYISQMKLALDLLSGDRDIFSVCEHIICVGLPFAVGNLLKEKMEIKNERSL